MSKKLIVVTGATGNQGGSVVDHLLSEPFAALFRVRAVTRNATSAAAKALEARGVEVVQADLNVLEQVQNAFRDAYGVFMMTNYWDSSIEHDRSIEITHGKNMAIAARDKKVHHVIFASLPNSNAISEGALRMPHYMNKVVIEKFMLEECASIPQKHFVHIGFYFSNFSTWFLPTIKEDGSVVFQQPLSATAALPTYDVRDTGAIVARCFAEVLEGKEHPQCIPLVAENMSLPKICQIITEVNGRKASHEPMSWEDFAVGRGEESIHNMRFYNDFAHKDHTRNPTICRGMCPDMKDFRTWLLESKWLQ